MAMFDFATIGAGQIKSAIEVVEGRAADHAMLRVSPDFSSRDFGADVLMPAGISG